jgi:hypothetical protein
MKNSFGLFSSELMSTLKGSELKRLPYMSIGLRLWPLENQPWETYLAEGISAIADVEKDSDRNLQRNQG